MLEIVVEKNVLELGEPIRGICRADGVKAKLIVLLATNLEDLERSAHIWKVVSSYTESFDLPRGEFVLNYPSDLPPSVYSQHLKVRWSLIFGIPRLGGKIFWPRRELRLKVFPREIILDEGDSEIRLESRILRPGDVIKGSFVVPGGAAELSLIGLKVEEWLRDKGRIFRNEYTAAEAEIYDANGERGRFRFVVEKDATDVRDVAYFYPYTFRGRVGGVEVGIEARVEIENEKGIFRKPVALLPKPPKLVRRKEGSKRSGPLLPI